MTHELPSTPGLLIEEDAHTRTLRIHNPGRANAIDDGILAAIVRGVEDTRTGLRAIVLTGSGDRHFSAGLDLGDLEGAELADRLRRGEALLREATAVIAAARVPVIAAVNGAAVGGGLELAVACDWRIAGADARLGMPAARLGVVYAPEGIARFLAILGPARTRELFVTGRPVDAARALEIGLVDRVVPDGELDGAVAEVLADTLASAPGAVAGTRAAIRLLGGAPGVEVAAAIERIRREAYASPEFAEGLAAFRERRPPAWSAPPESPSA